MRKLILFMHMSLDGYVADKGRAWITMAPGIFGSAVPALIKRSDTLLLGRMIADDFLDYWLNAEAKESGLSKGEIAYARWATRAHKVIMSKVDENLKWENIELRVVKSDKDMVRVVSSLKKRRGKNMIVHGGVRTARNLIRLGLVDEYQMVVHPVLLGKGYASIFESLTNRRALKLARVEDLKAGVVLLVYKMGR
ncbi:MAG TPA: dihydrofolate reductase family protein [Candidatus Eremiobacteraceae bacterium]|nr:dihydrofolate reductase family protein [Candidatus Eremiobacteraceae bacterium]